MPTSTSQWKPSPALLQATTNALQALARQYPRAFALARDNSEAGKAFVLDYAFAMSGVAHEAIVAAPRVWMAENKYAPKSSELAETARRVARSMRETGQLPVAAAKPSDPPPHPEPRNGATHDALIARLRAVSSCTWPEAADAYALLLAMADTPERRAALDACTLSDDTLREAVAAARRRRDAERLAKLEREQRARRAIMEHSA